jgi:hypothetical protein
VSQTVYRKGPDGPRTGEFSKKLLMSRIIYGILDNRLRINVDKLYAPEKLSTRQTS